MQAKSLWIQHGQLLLPLAFLSLLIQQDFKPVKTKTMKHDEIKVIESKESSHYRVTLNGIEICQPLYFTTFEEMKESRWKAKAIAFDEVLRSQVSGNKITVSYHSF